jgi:hypothetical protein
MPTDFEGSNKNYLLSGEHYTRRLFLLIRQRMLQACEAHESKIKSSEDIKMQSIQEELVRTFTRAVEAAFPDVPDVGVPVVPSSKFGDYQCNAAMQLSQLLKAQGIIWPFSTSFVSNVECSIIGNAKP